MVLLMWKQTKYFRDMLKRCLFVHRFMKGRSCHILERVCFQQGRPLFWEKNIMDTNLLLSDSPADLSLIIMFIVTIIFLAWLDWK